MKKKSKYSFTKNFIKILIESSEGFLSSKAFDKLINEFEVEADKYYFTKTSEANLIRIITSLFDRVSFLTEALKYPHHIEIITAIAANSNYLTDIVVRNPEYIFIIFNPDYLNEKITEESIIKEVEDGIGKYKTTKSKVNFLRLYKRRLTLKIGLNDILSNSEFTSTTFSISILAKVILSQLFKICHQEILNKHCITLKGTRYSITAVGKLGGRELNYSSDVDLLIFYDQNSIEGSDKKIEYHELLTQAIHFFIQCTSELTDKGYLYRVDFRLRPDGRTSPLCRTIADYLKYYETRGEYWERQMLIKIDLIGGSELLFNKFKDYLKAYVFPSSIFTSPLEQIRRMKLNIEQKIGDKESIKLFSGGIRDIEFSVQALQLIHGGRFRELRTGNSLIAIEQLKNKKLLEPQEAELLEKAYIFYRRVEHYLQLMNDRQTHVIPSNKELLNKLSYFIGFKTPREFKDQVYFYRKNVKAIFDSIINPEKKKTKTVMNDLDRIKFKDRKRARNNLEYLQSGTGLLNKKEFDARTISLFESLEPGLVNYLKNAVNPDNTLENFVRIIKTKKFPSIWYTEFKKKTFFKKFLFICEFNQRAVDLMVINKSIGDLFLSRKVFISNYEEQFASISYNQLLFILSVQLSLNLINHEKFSLVLQSFLINQLRKAIIEMNLEYKFFIAGLGSFGCAEQTFASDVDLIVVAENIDKNFNIQKDFQQLLIRLQQELKPVRIDFRLRPEGSNSPIVWDVNVYNQYLKKRARIWEFQSLLKLNFISGNEELFNKFKKILFQNVREIEKSELNKELIGMYNKTRKESHSVSNSINLKKSKGSILNIEYILDSIILKNANLYNDCIGKNILQKLSYLINSFKDSNEQENLKIIYSLLKTCELSVQNIFNVNNSLIPNDNEKKLLLAIQLGFRNIKEFEIKLNESIKTNNTLFEKYINS